MKFTKKTEKGCLHRFIVDMTSVLLTGMFLLSDIDIEIFRHINTKIIIIIAVNNDNEDPNCNNS